MRNEHILSVAFGQPWAITIEKLDEIRSFLIGRASGVEISAAEKEAYLLKAEERQRYQQQGSVAVIPVFGVVSQRMNLMSAMSGGTSTEALTKQIRDAAADSSVSAVVMNFDTPGGTVSGVTEAHAAIMEARNQKPIVAVVNSMAGSAGLWLASAATEITSTPSGSAGSLGIYAMHQDFSAMAEKDGVKVTYISAGKFKTEGNKFEPLSEDARAAIQAEVDHAYAMFVGDVAKGRGLAMKDVKENFGQGRMLNAQAALAAGMIDKIETFDATLSRVSRGKVSTGSRKAMQERIDMAAKFI